MMRIVVGRPPNFAAIAAAFPLAVTRPGVIFCYGDTIFNPTNAALSDALIAHEHTHCRQQGDQVEEWWKLYIESPTARLAFEIDAHRKEYLVASRTLTRNQRKQYLRQITARLAGPFYGRIISREVAERRILQAQQPTVLTVAGALASMRQVYDPGRPVPPHGSGP